LIPWPCRLPCPDLNLVVLTNQKARKKRSRYVDWQDAITTRAFRKLCFVDTDTGELRERRLELREEAEKFYRMVQGMRVCVGISAAGLILRSGEQSAHGSSRDLCGARVDGSGHRCRDTGFLSIREAKNTLGRRGCAPNEGDTHRQYPHPATACLTRSALLDAMIARHSQADAGRAAEHYNSPLGKLPVILSLSILCHRVLLFLWLNNPLPHPKIDGFQSA